MITEALIISVPLWYMALLFKDFLSQIEKQDESNTRI
jgi:hypothetical protein